jgi:hypothetical protein
VAPYSKKLKARYDGKNLVLDEPLDLPIDQVVEVTVDSEPTRAEPPTDRRPIEERLKALRNLGGLNTGIVLPNEAFRRDESMYPDRW